MERGYMLFNKKADEETLKVLLHENQRLKHENQRLNESLEELQRYKDEYKGLIEEVNRVKVSYIQKMKDFDEVEKEYRAELDRLAGKRRTVK